MREKDTSQMKDELISHRIRQKQLETTVSLLHGLRALDLWVLVHLRPMCRGTIQNLMCRGTIQSLMCRGSCWWGQKLGIARDMIDKVGYGKVEGGASVAPC